MNKSETKMPSNLILTSLLSSGITIVVSITYIVLSVLALVYRFKDCDAAVPETTGYADIFWNTIYRAYILSEDCEHQLPAPNVTQSYTVFVLVALTLSFSTLTLVTSIILAVLITKETSQYINVYVYAYIGTWMGSLVVDLTLGTHLGMDYTFLTDELATGTMYNPVLDIIRQGSFYLMAIALKGFAIHAINMVLIVLIIFYLYNYQDMSKQNEHSIHKVGTINAFDQPRRHDDNWTNPEMYAGPFGRGPFNNTFEEDPRVPTRADYHSNSRGPGSFRRSNSWNHQQGVAAPALQPMPSNSSSRPFSYLEEVRRPTPLKPPASPASYAAQASPASYAAQASPASPAAVGGWRGAWPAPPVPAPDYSPHTPRRLKSALKPNYM